MKRLTLLTGACLLALVLTSTAQASSGTNMKGLAGGCPPGAGAGWVLFNVESTIEGVDVGNRRDRNDDGYVCVRINEGLSKKTGGSLVVRDNNLRIPPGVVNCASDC